MKKTLLFFTALISISVYSQVGINTETPKATLDVVGNPTNAAKVDGVIIPRITGNELKAKDALYGADQTGTIIYATAAASPTSTKTAEITAAGFYYFNGSIWKASGSAGDTSIYTHDGTVTAGANRTVTIPDATNVNFNGVDSGSFYAWTDSGDIGLFGYQDFGKISLSTEGANADIKVRTTGTDSHVLLQPDSADKNVGIGTILPTAKLHTNGTVRMEGLAASTSNTSYLTTDINGNVAQTAIPNDWHITGNAGTTAGTHFLGTTDDVDMVFKRNSAHAGVIQATNVGLGVGSLPLSSTGTDNTAMGLSTLSSNTTGSNNVAVGIEALQNNTTGSNMTAIGRIALMTCTDCTGSVAVGAWALSMAQSGLNTAVGIDTMQKLTTGSFNSGVGTNTLISTTTGNNNSGYGDSVINDPLLSGSNNSGVGINSLNNITTGSQNSAFGIFSMRFTDGGNNNVAFGNEAGISIRGSNNTSIGKDSGGITTGSNNIAIGFTAQVPTNTSSNQIRMGNTAITSARVQVAWSVTSDQRWKTDIKNSDLGLNFIQQLRPVSYIRKNDKTQKTEYGFIAQELQETLKKNGVENSGMVTEDDNGMLSVRYNDLFAPLVKSIQEQQESLERDQERLNQIEAKLVALEKK